MDPRHKEDGFYYLSTANQVLFNQTATRKEHPLEKPRK